MPVLYALEVRPRLLTWGATPEEIGSDYRGEELLPEADGCSTMATTLPAPPEQVWPWLVQMGYDRAGWYSWDRLDRGGVPSADRIVPEWQDLQDGQRLNVARSGRNWFTVAGLEPRRTLVLRSSTALPSGRPFDPGSSPLPWAYLDGIWGFHLRPASGDRTRLVIRTRGRTRPRVLMAPFDLVVGEPAHFIMQTRQFHNLGTRVGGSCRRRPLLGLRRRPGRLALTVFRMPLQAYRHGGGWLLGQTFLQFVHTGRKTGQAYETVAMVLHVDAIAHEAVICAGWGRDTDWVRNLRTGPATRVQLGGESFTPQHRFLSDDEAFEAVAQFRQEHPWRLRVITRILGWGDLRDDSAVRKFITTHPFVAFRPTTASST
ncbi:MAG TPA: nitroreductase family deazaflavin-dependent oxidoreductase [Acidimicrobiales bacterium]|nr:nitroreductase family deazaflavin-dependent oxidoreductase [Acidimicrobiales bacterium]